MPAGDDWLGARERQVRAGLRGKRLDDWRLGRWTAKLAVGGWLGARPERIEIVAAEDGAPDAWIDGSPAPVSVSISHRAGRALAAVAAAPAVIGCDLELVEPRSGAFVREWMTDDEQRVLAGLGGQARDLVANGLWTAKEAAAKVRREGLRLDVRHAAVELQAAGAGWRELGVVWAEGGTTAGWWRESAGWVMTIAGAPAPGRPRRLEAAWVSEPTRT